MPKITTKTGKVKHLPYTDKGMMMANKMKAKGMKVNVAKSRGVSSIIKANRGVFRKMGGVKKIIK